MRLRIHTTTTLAGGFLALSIMVLTANAAGPTAFTDGFEGAALDPFWTPATQNGSITFPATDRVHSGAQSVRFNGTGGGQIELSLSHQFATPQYGTVSAWVYDSGEYIYFSIGVLNPAASPYQAGVGVQDWDGSAYYYGLFDGTGGKTTVARTRAWRQFTIRSTVSAFVLEIDGQEIYRGAGGRPFTQAVMRVSGPGGGTIWFDDFSFEPAPAPAGIQITSLSSTGQLTWTNAPEVANGLFAIEWAPAPGATWEGSWNTLRAFPVAGSTSTVAVPMVYRVKCVTNLFIPWPVGARLDFAVTNAVGSAWTEQMTILDLVKPSAAAGQEYALLENLQSGQMSLHLLRSTDASVYRFDPRTLVDSLEFQIGPAGTTWTNFNYEGQWTLKVTVDAVETVVLPSGTFPGCYKFHKEVLNPPGPDRADWYEWIRPGFGMVKWVDYWLDPADEPPHVHQLQSWSLPAAP